MDPARTCRVIYNLHSSVFRGFDVRRDRPPSPPALPSFSPGRRVHKELPGPPCSQKKLVVATDRQPGGVALATALGPAEVLVSRSMFSRLGYLLQPQGEPASRPCEGDY